MLLIAALNLPFTAQFDSDELTRVQEESKQYPPTASSLVRPEPQRRESEQEVPFDFAPDSKESASSTPLSAKHSGSPVPKVGKSSKSIVDERTDLPSATATPQRTSHWDPAKAMDALHKKLAAHSSASKARAHSSASSRVPTSVPTSMPSVHSIAEHKAAEHSPAEHSPAGNNSSDHNSADLSNDSASALPSLPSHALTRGDTPTDSDPDLINSGAPTGSDSPLIPGRTGSGQQPAPLACGGSPGDYDTQIEREQIARCGLSVQDAPSAIASSLAATPGSTGATYSAQNRYRRRNSSASYLSVDEQGVPFINRPFCIVPSGNCNRGMFNALDSALEKELIPEYKSVGLIGMPTDDIPLQSKWEITDRLLAEEKCYAVYVSDAEREGHYDNYCKEFMWPTFHCQTPDIPRSKTYEEFSWGDYVTVNQAIADKVVEAYEIGDTVWVHDYHLMLVPQMVREKLPQAPIGFFMHVAFPSSETFRSLAYRAELLSGVLASNHIAFHIPEYSQHFKMSLARILAVDITGPGVIETEDHDAFISSCPLGIDAKRLDDILDVTDSQNAVQQHRRVIRARWPRQWIIASRDKVDPIRGLSQKLRAFDKFLAVNPQWTSWVVLVQICTSGSDGSGIEAIADQINSRYGDIASGVQPVVLLKQDVKYEQYLALLQEANGFCVTCLRDGMNLTCHEFIQCNAFSRMGPLILSEFTGSANFLGNSALLVNPWDQEQLVQAFKACVEMPKWEREQRWLGLRKAVQGHTASDWATTLTKQITEAWRDEMTRQCVKPDLQTLRKAYNSVTSPDERRLFLLELERPSTVEAHHLLEWEVGSQIHQTYQHREKNPDKIEGAGPYYITRLPLVIRELCCDPRNIVYVISPESSDYMERMFRSLPGLGLIAEFGKYVRMRDSEQWVELTKGTDRDWQKEMEPWIMQLRDRSLLAEIESHASTLILRFNSTLENHTDARDYSMIGEYMSLIDDQYGRAHGIRTKLEGNTLTIYRNSLGRLRQRAFQHVLDSIPEKLGMLMMANQPYASDSDDVMYDWAESIRISGVTKELVTLIVGKHPSLAQWMVEGTNALLNLLQAMRTNVSVQKIGVRRSNDS